MAVAFYIPDQARLLRKAQQQEQQLLRLRASQWRVLVTIVLETLRQLVESTAAARTSNCMARSARRCGKWRKPSQ